MAISVFIDWFGTVADRRLAPQRYSEEMGHVLHECFGGSVEDGIQAHNVAYAWYLEEWPKRLRSAKSYRAAYQQMAAEYVRVLLHAYGRPSQRSDEEAFALNERLFSTLTLRVDVTYPDVQPALRRLKDLGCRIYPSSGAPGSDLKGLIQAAQLHPYFNEIISCEMLDADKNTPAYWRAALRHTGSDPQRSFAVDDSLRPLLAARELGCSCIVVDREGVSTEIAFPRITNLAPLPDLVMGGAERTRP